MKLPYILITGLIILCFCLAASSGKEQENHRHKRSVISRFLEKIIRKLTGKDKNVGKKCFDRIKNGEIPSAEHRDSPISTFGYPIFNWRLRSAVTDPGVTLSYIYGHRQPVKIGSRDYALVGTANKVLAFFACFESYKVIGSSMNRYGHWVPGTGSIKIQVQNVDQKGSKVTSTTFDILFKYTLDRIIKYLQPVKIIKGIDAQILGGKEAAKDADSMMELLEKVKEWLPGYKNLAKKIFDIFKKRESIPEKIKELIDFIANEEERMSALRKQWIGWDNVYKDEKLIVTLTMYPKPNHGVRSTFNTGKSTVGMGDIGEAIRIFLEKKDPSFLN